MTANPQISVIIPAHNSRRFIRLCLEALENSSFSSFEVIVVDDASTDGTSALAGESGAAVLELEQQSGPAVARNFGSRQARGDILLFIDSDVLVKPDTLGRVYDTFSGSPDIAAVFGSYDDSPSEPDFLSQYRNLLHHYVHQQSSPDASTFWAGCGAIRKNVFAELSGFDNEKFSEPSIEDIELGYRMREKGYAIRLDKELQVKHLKHWGWWSMIRTDVFSRAVPWSRLILETNSLNGDLNLRTSDRVSTALVGLLLAALFILALGPAGIYHAPVKFTVSAVFLIVALLVYLNRGLYGFFLDKRGLWFTARVIPVHFLYYFYCGVSFLFCWLSYKITSGGKSG